MTRPNPDDDPEILFHLEMLTRRYVEEGLDPVSAAEKARERMGDLRAAARARRNIEAPASALRTSWWRAWGHDVRHAARVLRRAPGFVGVAVLMIGLGTGAGTAVFSVVDAVLLRSAFVSPESIALVYTRRPNGQLTAVVPVDTYRRIAVHPVPPVRAVGLLTIASPVVTRVDTPRRTQTECLSPSVAGILGTRSFLGRWFTDEDARAGAPAVAVVSRRFWRGTLGSDPHVIGRVIALDEVPVTIIGVMPAGFDGPLSRVGRDLWVPYGLSSTTAFRLGCRTPGAAVNAIAKLDDGATLEQGRAALTAAAGAPIWLESMRTVTVGELEHPFNALVGAVLAVLFIACANVANLGLERLAGRRREIAIRLAIGATPGRIGRETVAEHVLVSLAGAALGVTIAAAGFDAMVALLPASLPNLDAIALNVRVLAAMLTLALAGGVATGVVSAWQVARSSQASGLAVNDRGHSSRHSHVRHVLVTAEIALGVLLLVAALLMVRTFLTLRPTAPGFDPNGKYLALIRLPAGTPQADRQAFVELVSTELLTQPGITAVASTTTVPMRRSVSIREATVGAETADVYTGAVSPNYFDLMGIAVVRGRPFTERDRTGAHAVAIVNETFARRFFPDSDPVGQTVTLAAASGSDVLQVVGVTGDTRTFGGDTRTRPFVYRPLAQADDGNSFFVMGVDRRAAAGLPATVRRVVASVRPDLLVDEVARLLDEMHAEVAQPRLGAWLFGGFAALAVLLAAVGLAATLTWSVTERRREIGIRVALGATGAHVRRLVVGQTMTMAAVGVGAGLVGAAWATRLLAGWLYGVSPLDAATFAACGAFMIAVALAAAWLPTRRASRVDPAVVLRGDA
jgi:putative ABC transport system permease protein